MSKERKKEIRSELRERRKMIDSESRKKLEDAIHARLKELDEFKNAKIILFYHSMPEEVDTRKLIEEYIETKKLVLPRVEGEKLVLHHIAGYHHIKKGAFGIEEPVLDAEIIKAEELDLAIIPGLGFDEKLGRIGMGGGFYDRLLNELNCPTIALAYDCQIVKDVPRENHDQLVDIIITETKIIQDHQNNN